MFPDTISWASDARHSVLVHTLINSNWKLSVHAYKIVCRLTVAPVRTIFTVSTHASQLRTGRKFVNSSVNPAVLTVTVIWYSLYSNMDAMTLQLQRLWILEILGQ
jgi:hypothetical protein